MNPIERTFSLIWSSLFIKQNHWDSNSLIEGIFSSVYRDCLSCFRLGLYSHYENNPKKFFWMKFEIHVNLKRKEQIICLCYFDNLKSYFFIVFEWQYDQIKFFVKKFSCGYLYFNKLNNNIIDEWFCEMLGSTRKRKIRFVL